MHHMCKHANSPARDCWNLTQRMADVAQIPRIGKIMAKMQGDLRKR
jgi:hypothetical protein